MLKISAETVGFIKLPKRWSYKEDGSHIEDNLKYSILAITTHYIPNTDSFPVNIDGIVIEMYPTLRWGKVTHLTSVEIFEEI